MDSEKIESLSSAQKFEITEFYILKNLSQRVKSENSRKVLNSLADYSDKHYKFLKNYTKRNLKENDLVVLFYVVIAKISGVTFAFKLLEGREAKAVKIYQEISKTIPEFKELVKDEEENEEAARRLINEESVKYIGSIVLGLNDALVELTGALAGFTLAMQNNKMIGSAGLITGIAAAMSMASSEYMSTKADMNAGKNPIKASIYTGITYMITVLLLITPYFISKNYITSLFITLGVAGVIILVFAFYASVVQGTSFWKRFGESILVSFGIAAISFLIGYLVRTFLHISI
jgi:VIT1/CCC1 family predicted Fe2+/Mn2+ transporter